MATDPAPDPEAAAAASLIATASASARRRLSEELDLILREFEVETVTLRDVIAVLHGRGYLLLIMLLALPFCAPVSPPGLSTPLGMVITLIGVRLSLGEKPWLPSRLLELRLPPATFRKVFAVTRKLMLGLEKVLRPRLLAVTGTARREQFHAVPIVVCAVLLLLPLPVPLSNLFPAWAVLLVAAGLLERDGLVILAGYLMVLASVAFFAAIAVLGVGALDLLWYGLEKLLPGSAAG